MRATATFLLQTYRHKQGRTIMDVRIRDEHIQGAGTAYRFHTKRDLRGDTEARLRELYPHRRPMTHPGGRHVHY